VSFIHFQVVSGTVISWNDVLGFGGNFAHGLCTTLDGTYWGCLCCCALEFKGGHEGKIMREGDKGCPASL